MPSLLPPLLEEELLDELLEELEELLEDDVDDVLLVELVDEVLLLVDDPEELVDDPVDDPDAAEDWAVVRSVDSVEEALEVNCWVAPEDDM